MPLRCQGLGGHKRRVRLSDLGARIDQRAALAMLASLGKSGNLVDDLLARARARRGRLEEPSAPDRVAEDGGVQ